MQQPNDPSAIAKLSVFVVEDEALVAINLESILEDLGCHVVGTAMSFEEAQEMVAAGVAADVAILDVNLGGRHVYPIAEAMTARNIPVIFATGYGRSGLAAEWQDRAILQKPYTEQNVAELLAAAAGRRAGEAG